MLADTTFACKLHFLSPSSLSPYFPGYAIPFFVYPFLLCKPGTLGGEASKRKCLCMPLLHTTVASQKYTVMVAKIFCRKKNTLKECTIR